MMLLAIGLSWDYSMTVLFHLIFNYLPTAKIHTKRLLSRWTVLFILIAWNLNNPVAPMVMRLTTVNTTAKLLNKITTTAILMT